MSDWTNPHPYQADRQVRDVVGGRLHLPPGPNVRMTCVACGALVATTVHGGHCRACAEQRLKMIEWAYRRAK